MATQLERIMADTTAYAEHEVKNDDAARIDLKVLLTANQKPHVTRVVYDPDTDQPLAEIFLQFRKAE